MFDKAIVGAEGIVKIKDHVTGEILRDERNAVHFGNLSAAIAKALAWEDSGHIRYMAFGNNGTTIDSSGVIVYKETNTSLIFDPNSTLYNATYAVEVENNEEDPNTDISYNLSTSNFADIVVTVVLPQNEPTGQDDLDNSDGSGDFVFDEIALWAGSSGRVGDIQNGENIDSDLLMLTHVIFHPVQKSANRIIEIEYTLRIQMGQI